MSGSVDASLTSALLSEISASLGTRDERKGAVENVQIVLGRSRSKRMPLQSRSRRDPLFRRRILCLTLTNEKVSDWKPAANAVHFGRLDGFTRRQQRHDEYTRFLFQYKALQCAAGAPNSECCDRQRRRPQSRASRTVCLTPRQNRCSSNLEKMQLLSVAELVHAADKLIGDGIAVQPR
jgi:hypothetical protein